jgi:hypothetical protein
MWLGGQNIDIHTSRQEGYLQGLKQPTMQVNNILAKQVYKSTQGNDIWAYVILDINRNRPSTTGSIPTTDNEDIQLLLHQYADVFNDPETLPPPCSYDHAIPLYPEAVPINSRPYHYSPQHKI